MKKKFVFLSVAILFQISPIKSQAEIFQCKGEDGVINFTSVPCGQKAHGIKQAPPRKEQLNPDGTKKTHQQITTERLDKEKEFIEANRRQAEDENKKRAKLAEHENRVKKNCEDAKKKVTTYERSNYLYDKGANGEKVILSDKERNKAEAEAQREQSYWCRQ